MVKKCIILLLAASLAFCLCVFAENTENGGDFSYQPASEDFQRGEGKPERDGKNMPPDGEMRGERGDFTPPSGDMPFSREDSVEGELGENTEKNEPSGNFKGDGENAQAPDFAEQENERPAFGFSEADENDETSEESTVLGFVKNYSSPLISVAALILAFLFVVFYKRKMY